MNSIAPNYLRNVMHMCVQAMIAEAQTHSQFFSCMYIAFSYPHPTNILMALHPRNLHLCTPQIPLCTYANFLIKD